jgi:hypothetical protein
MKIISFLFFLFPAGTVVAQFTVTRIGKGEIPQSIKYTGTVVEAIRYTDKWGEHIVITTQTGETASKNTSDGTYRDAALYAYHYTKQGDSLKQTWRVYDFIKDCELDILVEFNKNTLEATDIDKDGRAEVWLVYKLACTGDVSPAEMKIIMYSANKKYAMRGTEKVQVGAAEFAGGEYTFDEAFKKAPASLRQYAMALWKKNRNRRID